MGQKRNLAFTAALGLCLMLFLMAGGTFFTNYLKQQIFVERATQLVELTAQVRANLNSALDTHWNYLTAAVNLLETQRLSSEEETAEYIGNLEHLLAMDNYSSMLMLLDDQGNCYDDQGKHGVWADVDLISGGEEHCTFISDSYIYEGSYWIFVERLKFPLRTEDGLSFTHAVLLKDVRMLTQYYDSAAYGSQSETYILKSNGTRMHDDISQKNMIQAYNVLKVLEEMEGQQYPDIRAALTEHGTLSTNFMNHGEEYYYCITSLEEYDTLLLFLIPARFVASGTVNMVSMVIRTLLLLAVSLLALLLLTTASVIRQRNSARMVLQEQANLRRQEELNAQLEETNALLARSKESAEQAFRIAEEANQAKSSFLSNMSHDIRTPMNAIVGFAALLARDADKPEKVRGYTQKITSSSQHLLGLINDILDISKIEAGKTTLNLSDEHMGELLENIDSIIRPQMKMKGHTFEIDKRELRHEYLIMDKLRLNQILLNLLSNAVKYTPDHGRITLTVEERPPFTRQLAHYRFVVADNGYGMSKEYQAKLFQAFTREEDSVTNKIQGTGLGMAITKNLLDLMGGTILVESEKGKGSTFTVDLEFHISEHIPDHSVPGSHCAEIAPNQGTPESADEKSLTEKSVFQGMHILVAEDNEINGEILGELLDMSGASCDIYENGQLVVEAFEKSAPGQYQLILMDVQMPVMNGYEATRAIRKLKSPEALSIPIIAMTANAFAEDIRDALEAGMNAHVAKPVDMEVLERTVKTVLTAKQEG